MAGCLTHVLVDGGDDANRTSYRWPARLRGSGGAHTCTSSNGGKSLSERDMEGMVATIDDLINNNDRQQQQLYVECSVIGLYEYVVSRLINKKQLRYNK